MPDLQQFLAIVLNQSKYHHNMNSFMRKRLFSRPLIWHLLLLTLRPTDIWVMMQPKMSASPTHLPHVAFGRYMRERA